MIFPVGAASAATFASSKIQGFEVIRAASAVTLASSKTESSGLKPLLQKPSFCRSGFSRDLRVIENQGLGIDEAVFTATPTSSKTESSGLPKTIFS
jgi:hypothetical protein